jgi:hypothetical protein
MGLALPAPSAFAHGNQFICARVTLGPDGLVALELTADHGDNPNIADAGAAQQVLREALRIQLGNDLVPLEQVARMTFAESDRYSVDAPMWSAEESAPHRLVTARWQANLPGHRLVFVAKDRTPFDVVMWNAAGVPEAGRSRWILLIAGDRSPEFITTPASGGWPPVLGVLVSLVVVLLIAGWRWLRRQPTVGTAAVSA